jgi:hypothetical protein
MGILLESVDKFDCPALDCLIRRTSLSFAVFGSGLNRTLNMCGVFDYKLLHRDEDRSSAMPFMVYEVGAIAVDGPHFIFSYLDVIHKIVAEFVREHRVTLVSVLICSASSKSLAISM